MKATEVTAGLAESNGSLLPGLRRDSLHVACGLTACTPGSAPGPTLGNEYRKTLPFGWCGLWVCVFALLFLGFALAVVDCCVNYLQYLYEPVLVCVFRHLQVQFSAWIS